MNITFTAKDAASLQMEGDIVKRTEIIANAKKSICDCFDNDNLLANIQYDLVLIARTASTRIAAFPTITDVDHFNEVKGALEDAGYIVFTKPGLNKFFVKFTIGSDESNAASQNQKDRGDS